MNMFRIIMFAMLTWLSAGCTPENAAGNDGLTDLDPIVVSRICQTDEGKPYLEVDGKPFPVYGAQIRVDIFRSVDKMDWPDIELYFAIAKQLFPMKYDSKVWFIVPYRCWNFIPRRKLQKT